MVAYLLQFRLVNVVKSREEDHLIKESITTVFIEERLAKPVALLISQGTIVSNKSSSINKIKV